MTIKVGKAKEISYYVEKYTGGGGDPVVEKTTA